jgi:hypothetical protein
VQRKARPSRFVPKETKFEPRRQSRETPVYLSIPEAAAAMNRETESARRWLTRAKLVTYRGGKPCIVVEKFLPECRQRLFLGD